MSWLIQSTFFLSIRNHWRVVKTKQTVGSLSSNNRSISRDIPFLQQPQDECENRLEKNRRNMYWTGMGAEKTWPDVKKEKSGLRASILKFIWQANCPKLFLLPCSVDKLDMQLRKKGWFNVKIEGGKLEMSIPSPWHANTIKATWTRRTDYWISSMFGDKFFFKSAATTLFGQLLPTP